MDTNVKTDLCCCFRNLLSCHQSLAKLQGDLSKYTDLYIPFYFRNEKCMFWQTLVEEPKDLVQDLVNK